MILLKTILVFQRRVRQQPKRRFAAWHRQAVFGEIEPHQSDLASRSAEPTGAPTLC